MSQTRVPMASCVHIKAFRIICRPLLLSFFFITLYSRTFSSAFSSAFPCNFIIRTTRCLGLSFYLLALHSEDSKQVFLFVYLFIPSFSQFYYFVIPRARARAISSLYLLLFFNPCVEIRPSCTTQMVLAYDLTDQMLRR